MNYPVYQQNYPQYPVYPQYAPGPFQAQYAQSIAAQPAQALQSAPLIQQPTMSSSVVTVHDETEARNWPVAPNNSVTFVDEINGYLYTKTSFNQFDRPQFVKYKLVREDAVEAPARGAGNSQSTDTPYASKEDLTALAGAVQGVNENVNAINGAVTALRDEVEKINSDMYGLQGRKKTASAKKDEPAE